MIHKAISEYITVSVYLSNWVPAIAEVMIIMAAPNIAAPNIMATAILRIAAV